MAVIPEPEWREFKELDSSIFKATARGERDTAVRRERMHDNEVRDRILRLVVDGCDRHMNVGDCSGDMMLDAAPARANTASAINT